MKLFENVDRLIELRNKFKEAWSLQDEPLHEVNVKHPGTDEEVFHHLLQKVLPHSSHPTIYHYKGVGLYPLDSMGRHWIVKVKGNPVDEFQLPTSEIDAIVKKLSIWTL